MGLMGKPKVVPEKDQDEGVDSDAPLHAPPQAPDGAAADAPGIADDPVGKPKKAWSPRTDKAGGEGADEAPGFLGRMRAAFGSLVAGAGANEAAVKLGECDLTEEELEELHMLSVFSEKELRILRLRFLQLSGGAEWLHKDKLLELQELASNPLRDRVVACFDTDKDGYVAFREFVVTASNFSPRGPREKKLGLAFKIHDMDGDEKISKADLKSYLTEITHFNLKAEELEQVAAREAEEASHGAAADVEARVAFNRKRVTELKAAAKETKNKDLKRQVGDYERRIKVLETEGILDRVVEKTFEEASTDREFLTRDDFVRVVGHTDFQGKLTIDFCARVRIAK